MGRRELRDFDNTPLDGCVFRTLLPVAKVTIDSGPLPPKKLYAAWDRCERSRDKGYLSHGTAQLTRDFCTIMYFREEVLECQK